MTITRVSFTDNRLRKWKHDGRDKRLYFYDQIQPGLALQITQAGTKSFQLQTWDKGRGRSVVKSIGRYPQMSIEDARKTIASMIVAINNGENILEAARLSRDEECLDELFVRWLKGAKAEKKRSWKHDESRYENHIRGPLGRKRISDLTRDRVRKWFHSLMNKDKSWGTGTLSSTTANRCLSLISTIFSIELPGYPNPCKGIRKYKETSRDRFIQPSEMKKFFKFLEAPETPSFFRDYIMLSLLTGARRSNVLSMRWVDIDFDRRIWTIQADESKNMERMVVPLLPQALAILRPRWGGADSVFVFPSRKSATGHVVNPRKPWLDLLGRAKLENLRLHDLRRTLGSFMTMAGASTAIVGKTLGHRSHEATAVYARLNLDPVRDSMEAAVDMMLATKDLPEKVVSLKK